MTCWRRLRDWQELAWLARCGEIDWSRAVVDGSSIRAVFGTPDRTESNRPGHAGPQTSSDLRRTRSSAGHQLTGANRNDSQPALALVDAIPSLQGERGAHAIVLIAYSGTVVMTLRQPAKVCVPATSSLFLQSATPNMAARRGRWRWVVERTFAWLNQFRRMRVRYESGRTF